MEPKNKVGRPEKAKANKSERLVIYVEKREIVGVGGQKAAKEIAKRAIRNAGADKKLVDPKTHYGRAL